MAEGYHVTRWRPPRLAARPWGISEEIAERADRAHRAMADAPANSNWSCAPLTWSPAHLRGQVADRTPPARAGAAVLSPIVYEFGFPTVKLDIEGADRHCILAIHRGNRPKYLSFEAGDDLEELVEHMASIGYRKFKLIGQCSFLELGNERSLRNRIRRRVMRILGFAQPLRVRRAGRWFRLMHSSGPAPWTSDGAWYSAESLLCKWNQARRRDHLMGWYDVHAC